jgi:hypothetical protein
LRIRLFRFRPLTPLGGVRAGRFCLSLTACQDWHIEWRGLFPFCCLIRLSYFAPRRDWPIWIMISRATLPRRKSDGTGTRDFVRCWPRAKPAEPSRQLDIGRLEHTLSSGAALDQQRFLCGLHHRQTRSVNAYLRPSVSRSLAHAESPKTRGSDC